VLSVAHFAVDAYSSFLSPLLPLLVARLHLSLASVGTLFALLSITASLSQPLFGMWADRMRRPWFIALGPLVAAVFMSSVGWTTSFPALAAVVMLGGLGAAAFHPQAAVIATTLGLRPAASMSLFVTGGTLGMAFGPLLAVTVVGLFGLPGTWVAGIPGVVVALLLFVWFARVSPRPRPRDRAALSALRRVWRPLALIYSTAVVRSAVGFGFATFLPLLLHREGVSVANAGLMLTGYLAAGGLGGFLSGWLADRWGHRSLLAVSFAAALPLFAGFLLLPLRTGLPCLILAAFVLQSALPVNVVMGQALSPRHASTVSSLMMGAAWGVGQLLAGPLGAAADVVGIRNALLGLSGLLLVGSACSLALPKLSPRLEPVVVQ
jgi:FSR family fosmidomycin resistance protein-like MFS transporter